MEVIPIKRSRNISEEVDVTKCIICQQVTQLTTTSSNAGRKLVRDAAEVRQDEVLCRLERVDLENFVYHVSNKCYKTYTHKKALDKLTKQQLDKSFDELKSQDSNNKPRQSRLNVKPREPATTPLKGNTKTKECIVCGKCKNKGETRKFRISESERARRFLKAAVYNQDEVYVKTCDLQDIHSVFGADLFYHNNCMRWYIKQYEDDLKTNEHESNKKLARQECFHNFLNTLHLKLQNGERFVLSDLKEKINSQFENDYKLFTNKELRLLLFNYYGTDVCFTNPKEANKSAVIYLKSVSTGDLVDSFHSTDVIKSCAYIIRQSLLDSDFNLSDKFCDATDLKESWDDTVIPPELLQFFGILFNFNPTSFYGNDHTETVESCESDEDEEDSADGVQHNFENNNDNKRSEQSISESKRRKMKALHQILYFDVHNGSKRTPLHLMNAQSIHEKCKSRELITSFNHFGLSISYNELQRYHNDMAGLIIESNQGHIPLPSQFDPQQFTIAAFDNFDHEEATLSGLEGSHDTVSVLFQEKPNNLNRKPNISETNIQHGKRVLQELLPCQQLHEFTKSATKPDLPTDYEVNADMYVIEQDIVDDLKKQDLAWSLGRMDLSHIDTNKVIPGNKEQKMPSWSAFNSVVTNENLSEKIVGFLPVIPSPVTDYRTVYTSLKNFQDILKQLDQDKLAITCDEGVYHIAREITMGNTREFNDIVLCLGSFHMTKIFLGCIGKFLRNSGAENIWVENSVFGPNVVKSVLSGTHYVRSIKGMILLGEAMERLQWCEFFKYKGALSYLSELQILLNLNDTVSEKQAEVSRQLLDNFKKSSDGLITEFTTFTNDRSNDSETFKYWSIFIRMTTLLKNLVRADREGNWALHLGTVQAILPYFAQFDCINYLRWCSLYLEDMRKLPETAPDIHQSFQQGQFVVKRTLGRFKAVGADQCLEQTINRSQKSSGGIIGSSRRKEFVAQWEIIYHEMLSVNNLRRELSGSKQYYHELSVNHEFSVSETLAREANLTDMIDYIQLYDNPFSVNDKSEPSLHNIVTQQLMTKEIRQSILNVEENGKSIYLEFRNERFIEKSKRLSETIHRNNIKTFQSIDTAKPSERSTKRKLVNETAAGHRVLEIAQSRGYDTKQLFKYDLIPTNYLFNEEGIMKKPVKSALCHELEKTLDSNSENQPSKWQIMKTVYLVDVMANIRKVNLRGFKTFSDLCNGFSGMIQKVCKNAERIDFVFDSYIEGSIKDSERLRRASIKPVEINRVQEDTPLPVNMDTFWASITNKAKLQKLLRKWMQDNALHVYPITEIVLSGVFEKDSISICQSIHNGNQIGYPQLDINIEEADERLMPHALHATDTGAQRIVLLSGDTDVMVLALYFWQKFKAHGLHQLWMRAGVGDTTRYIPLHVIADKKNKLCEVLPAVHILTGCDTTSKIGTKLSALKVSPELYLSEFGKSLTDHNQEDIICKAEKYLVKVLKPTATCSTMDELRYNVYHHSKVIDLHALPPTSSSIREHILRSLYTTYVQTHCFQNIDTDPTAYGYEQVQGSVIPSNNQHAIPDGLICICNCKVCSTKRCACRIAGIPCCVYCKCRQNGDHCNNPYITVSLPIML